MTKHKVVVPKDSVFSGTGKVSGKSFSTQTMGLIQDNGLAVQFKNFLRNPSEALPQGSYTVELGDVFIDKNGNLVLKPEFVKA